MATLLTFVRRTFIYKALLNLTVTVIEFNIFQKKKKERICTKGLFTAIAMATIILINTEVILLVIAPEAMITLPTENHSEETPKDILE